MALVRFSRFENFTFSRDKVWVVPWNSDLELGADLVADDLAADLEVVLEAALDDEEDDDHLVPWISDHRTAMIKKFQRCFHSHRQALKFLHHRYVFNEQLQQKLYFI